MAPIAAIAAGGPQPIGQPDPGGAFAFDIHRRVVGHLPIPTEAPMPFAVLLQRIDEDAPTPIGLAGNLTPEAATEAAEQLREVLAELIELGYVAQEADNYLQTAAGYEVLTGPALTDALPDGQGGIKERIEPPPLKGARLKAAEALDAELEAEAEADEKRERAERIERLKAELADAEAEGKPKPKGEPK